jgi:crotonobetainyl-CoA:carnitine CoA-transferase CaiB-like acyl-CoA transferase
MSVTKERSSASRDPGPLEGLTVVDLSTNLSSAYTTLLFADYGAEVIQVERPGGSHLRQMPAWPFWMRGKKSVVLDIRRDADRATAVSLATQADVVVEAFGAGKAEEFGLAYETLAAANPRLVYTSITGFGHRGPYSHLKAYEQVVMAKTGSMYGNMVPSRPGEPVMTTPFGATLSGALLAIQGTLLALHAREASGCGQRVDATMIQGMLAQDPWSYFMKILADRYPDAFTAVGAPAPGRRVPTSWLGFGLLNGYSRDGRWLQFAHATPRQYDAFVRSLGLDWAKDDPELREATENPDDEIRDRWWTLLLEGVRARTVAEWQAVFDVDKDVFAEVYLGGRELFDHGQMIHDGHFTTVEDPDLGPVKEMGLLVRMSATPGWPDRRAPRLGEHGSEIRGRRTPARSQPAGGQPERRAPLAGLTVIDLGTFYAGPFASTMLADQGATVIKIEPLDGDPIRYQMPVPESAGVRVTQGKKSIAVDVFTDEGRQIALDLISKADIVLHTYRGGVAERMGLDAESVRAVNPNLIYHHGVGYGVDGPYARRAAFAPTIAAASGFARRSGGGGPEGVDLSLEEIKDATVRMGGAPPGHPDGMAALGVAVGMLLGLYARDRGAGGQVTGTSMLSTMGHMLSDVLIEYEGMADPAVTDPEALGFGALYRLYRASDAWIVLCAPEPTSWGKLVDALAPELNLGDDARFADEHTRIEHDQELAATLAACFSSKPAAEWEQTLSAAGVGCAEVAPMQGGLAMGLFAPGGVGEQLGLLTTVTHPTFDEHVRATELVRLSHGLTTLGPGCLVGQHTDEILREMLGYDEARITALRVSGVVSG